MDVDSIEIREMKDEDIDAVLFISSSQLGPSYLSRSELQKYVKDSRTKIPVLVNKSIIIGYSIIHIVPKKMLDEYAKADIESSFPSLDSNDNIQLRKTTAIHQDYTGKGFGRKFIEETMKMYGSNCRLILSINWKRKDDIPMKKISENMGMKSDRDIPNYWLKESLDKKYICPECGMPPCYCTAVLFTKEVN